MTERKTVLVVDDEALFLRTLLDGFAAYSDRLQVLSAPNGRVAMDLLGRHQVDIVVTDLHMPEVDGFELLAYMSRRRPSTPVIVMTAFGTPEIEKRLNKLGVSTFLDKPLTFKQIVDRVFETLDAHTSGHLQGIALPTFLQMIAMERKSCSLRVRAGGHLGTLHFQRGELMHAEAGGKTGDSAALEIITWDQAQLEIAGGLAPRKTVQMPLAELLLEGFRLKDEAGRGGAVPEEDAEIPSAGVSDDEISIDEIQLDADSPPDVEPATREAVPAAPVPSPDEGATNMKTVENLKELQAIEGFAGAGVFTPTGEALAVLPGEVGNINNVGVLANNVLLNAQKASLEMGTGRGQQVHVECEKAHLIARCLNEGTDPIRSQPGKAHIHLVLALKNDAPIGLAKLRVNSVIEKLAEDFRG